MTKSTGRGRNWRRYTTHCSQGHEFTSANTIQVSLGRKCRKCAQLLAHKKKKQLRQRAKDYVRQAKSGPCMDCGRSYPSHVMDFDHREGTVKVSDINQMIKHCMSNVKFEQLKMEIAKCDRVCANCHRIRTYERAQAVVA